MSLDDQHKDIKRGNYLAFCQGAEDRRDQNRLLMSSELSYHGSKAEAHLCLKVMPFYRVLYLQLLFNRVYNSLTGYQQTAYLVNKPKITFKTYRLRHEGSLRTHWYFFQGTVDSITFTIILKDQEEESKADKFFEKMKAFFESKPINTNQMELNTRYW